MTTRADSIKPERLRLPEKAQPLGGVLFDWAVIALSGWFLGGLFLDGWAHNQGQADESFFTPWHAVFYSGFFAVAGFLCLAWIRNRLRGYPWLRALPAGYELSLVGALIFAVGGVGDVIWHILLGIEVDVEALLSPTHLLLALGGTLILSGPLRAAWRRSGAEAAQGWATLLPMLLSVTFTLSLFTFMTQYAHPLVDPWAAQEVSDLDVNSEIYVMSADGSQIAFTSQGHPPSSPSQALGMVSILLQAGLLMGVILYVVRRWALPLGGLTLILTLNAVAMSTQQDQFWVVPVAVMAGLAADLLLWKLKPSATRPGALRLFAFAVPAIFYGLYFLALELTEGIGWSVHLWTGSVVLAGVVGLLLSYVLVAPSVPAEQPQHAGVS